MSDARCTTPSPARCEDMVSRGKAFLATHASDCRSFLLLTDRYTPFGNPRSRYEAMFEDKNLLLAFLALLDSGVI